ncbi:MAG: hypothetical protein JNM17_08300 [Archangium sp.]|nr:hypothetical protein [Archangium sp.]
MTQAEATTLVDLILEAHQRTTASWGQRVLEYGRAERSGDFQKLSIALGELYVEPAPTPAQKLMIARLEDRVIPQLAAALGEPPEKLRARLHGGREIFSGDAPWVAQELEGPEAVSRHDVAGPEGWVHHHSFRVFGEALVIGGRPDDVGSSLTIKVPNGDWHVFRALERRGILGFFRRPESRLVVVHDSALARAVDYLAATRELSTTEDRVLSIVDAAARRDSRIRSRIDLFQSSGRSYTFTSDELEQHWRGARDDDDQLVLCAC